MVLSGAGVDENFLQMGLPRLVDFLSVGGMCNVFRSDVVVVCLERAQESRVVFVQLSGAKIKHAVLKASDHWVCVQFGTEVCLGEQDLCACDKISPFRAQFEISKVVQLPADTLKTRGENVGLQGDEARVIAIIVECHREHFHTPISEFVPKPHQTSVHPV